METIEEADGSSSVHQPLQRRPQMDHLIYNTVLPFLALLSVVVSDEPSLWPGLDNLFDTESKGSSKLSTKGVLNLGKAVGDGCGTRLIWRDSSFERVSCSVESKPACFDTVQTHYNLVEVMECKEDVRKDCTLDPTPIVHNVTVQICDQNLIRRCNSDGNDSDIKDNLIENDILCTKESSTECIKRFVSSPEHRENCSQVAKRVCNNEDNNNKCNVVNARKCEIKEKVVERLLPHVDCSTKESRVCGRPDCPLMKTLSCRNHTQVVVQKVPEERCWLSPERSCGPVMRLMPALRTVKHCMDVQQEKCTRTKIDPRKLIRDRIRKLCSENSNDFGSKQVSSFLNETKSF